MLTNNREIIGTLIEDKESVIILKNVISIVVSQNPETQELKKEFAPLTMFAKNGEKGIKMDLPRTSVLFSYALDTTLEAAYTTFVTGIATPPKPKIIV